MSGAATECVAAMIDTLPPQSLLRAFSSGSVVQAGACGLMAAALHHPAAASSSLLPGWTATGRGALSGML